MRRPLRRFSLLATAVGLTAASVLATAQIAAADDADDPVPPPVVIPWYLSPSDVNPPSGPPPVVVPFEPIPPLTVQDGIGGHADVDHGGFDDLYLPTDTTESHNNLVLAAGGLAVVAIPNANGQTATGDAQNQCMSAVDNTPATLGINLSPEPFDQSNPYRGGPGSWVCVRTNERNLVLLRIDTVRQATSTDGSGAEVAVTVTSLWHSS